MVDRKVEFSPGERLGVPERTREASDSLTGPMSELRGRLNEFLSNRRLQPANENITTGTFVGAVGTFIVWSLETYIPGQVGADASISNTEVKQNSVVYTVDTNAAIESQARFMSIIDAGTGVTSLWTDDINVTGFEVVKERPIRDTYRYEIEISK